jgi:hypothetical protein
MKSQSTMPNYRGLKWKKTSLNKPKRKTNSKIVHPTTTPRLTITTRILTNSTTSKKWLSKTHPNQNKKTASNKISLKSLTKNKRRRRLKSQKTKKRKSRTRKKNQCHRKNRTSKL